MTKYPAGFNAACDTWEMVEFVGILLDDTANVYNIYIPYL